MHGYNILRIISRTLNSRNSPDTKKVAVPYTIVVNVLRVNCMAVQVCLSVSAAWLYRYVCLCQLHGCTGMFVCVSCTAVHVCLSVFRP